jgi:hypothetical protein
VNCSAFHCEAFTIQLAIPDEITDRGWAVVESNTAEVDIDDHIAKIFP